jgi:hypothetical protein
VYESLVLGDPGAEADRLAASGQAPAAIQKLQDAITQLENVAGTVNNNRDRFSDKAATSEMLRSISRRQNNLNKKIQELQPTPHPEAVKGDPANADPAKAEGPPEGAAPATPSAAEAKAAPDPARVSWLNNQISHYITDLQTNRANEQQKFAQIDSEYHHWYRNPEPGPRHRPWDPERSSRQGLSSSRQSSTGRRPTGSGETANEPWPAAARSKRSWRGAVAILLGRGGAGSTARVRKRPAQDLEPAFPNGTRRREAWQVRCLTRASTSILALDIAHVAAAFG